MSTFTGKLGDGVQKSYATAINYSPFGALSKEEFGTTAAVYHKLHYNIRGQLYDVRVSNVNDVNNEWTGELGALVNYYSTPWAVGGSGADNNGNVLGSQTIIGNSYMEDRYSYDSLNRLASVSEYFGTYTPSALTAQFAQVYVYDRYGNRTINQTNTWGVGINKRDFTVNTTNNRLGVPSGQSGTMSYDNAGNLTTDTYSGSAVTRVYDAENRMASETQTNSNVAGTYIYNADGQRVRRNVYGVETWQVYGMDGELLAEYAANASAASPQKEYGYRNGQLLITAEPSSGTRTNVAAAANGATATAQNYTQDGVYPGYHWQPSYAIDGQRYCHLIADGSDGTGVWRDEHGLSSWLEVDFNGSKTIDEVDVFTMPDYPALLTQADPSPTQTFNSYGATAFEVQYWNPDTSGWTTVPGGSITGNNLVWKKVNFAVVTTAKIRVVVNAAPDSVARIAEVEVWGTPAATAPVNVAAASNGATATAQNYTADSTYPGYHWQPSYAIDGQRYCHLIADGSDGTGVWRDEHGLSSWLQVDFNGSKTINEVDLFTMPDYPALLTQADPSATQTFTQFGASSFTVQYWTGSAWATVPGGSITGNNLVWRKLNFTAVTTTKIRVVVNTAVDGVARIAEVEAWTASSGGGTANINWLVTDQLGTPRMIIDKTGALANVKRHDYLPFGEELLAGTGGRTPTQGYLGDSVRQKFTQKERDNETGLDYFGARYYGSVQGRFTTPDELTSSPLDLATLDSDLEELQALPYADVSNPQSLNKYQYGLNNPLIYLDADGHDVIYVNDRLKDRVGSISKESDTFAEEINKMNEDKNIRVVFAERGLRSNDEKSSGDAEITFTEGGFVFVTIFIDSYGRTNDYTIEHEVGHGHDARTNGDQLRKDAEKTKKDKSGPNALPHDDRPEEKRANAFRDAVEKERKEFRKQQQMERKRAQEQRKREEQERKRRENEERKSKHR